MKKFLNVLLVVTLLTSMMFVLSACGEKENVDDEKQNIVQEDENEVNNNDETEKNNENEENENIENNDEELGEVIVKSTEDALIMTDETGTVMTFKFDGEQITSLSMSTEAETEEEAEMVKQLYSTEEMATMCTVTVEGKTVIMEYTEEMVAQMFEGETRTTIEATLADEGYTIVKE